MDINNIKIVNPPNMEPKNSLSLDVFLFKMILIPYKRIKSNKKLIKKI